MPKEPYGFSVITCAATHTLSVPSEGQRYLDVLSPISGQGKSNSIRRAHAAPSLKPGIVHLSFNTVIGGDARDRSDAGNSEIATRTVLLVRSPIRKSTGTEEPIGASAATSKLT